MMCVDQIIIMLHDEIRPRNGSPFCLMIKFYSINQINGYTLLTNHLNS